MLLEKIQLEPGEIILMTVRKHWFVIVMELFVAFFMMLLPFFILSVIFIFPNFLNIPGFNLSSYTTLIIFTVSAWLVISLMVGFMTWTHYYLDLWIVTDRRLISVDQIAFFNRKVSVFRLERLQDIEVIIDGILPTFLNFGTIKAQTAGSAEHNFLSRGVPDPRGIQSVIQSAMDNRLTSLHIRPTE
jgi:Bacterial PH domain